MPLKRFPLDAAIVFADIMSPLPAHRRRVRLRSRARRGRPDPQCRGHRTAAREPHRTRSRPRSCRRFELTRAALPATTALLGFCGAPWTLAAYLVEGRGTKEFPTLRAFAAAEPALLDALLGRSCRGLMAEYLIRTGRRRRRRRADLRLLGRAAVREDWERLIQPHLTSLLETVGARRRAAHPVPAERTAPRRGIRERCRPKCSASTGASISAHCSSGIRNAPCRVTSSPAILHRGRGGDAAAKPRSCSASVAPRGHIVNLGHGILPQTPLASVEALVEVVHVGPELIETQAHDKAAVRSRGTSAARSREKGRRNGQANLAQPAPFHEVHGFRPLPRRARGRRRLVRRAGSTGALYVDANDPQGIGIMVASEDPDYFVTRLATLFNRRPFADFVHRPRVRHARSQLLDRLRVRPRGHTAREAARKAAEPREYTGPSGTRCSAPRSSRPCPADHQRRILAEHGSLAKRYGAGGHAADVRLACHGLDSNDNDFIVGLARTQATPAVGRRAGNAQDGADRAVPRQPRPVFHRQGRLAELRG